MSFKKPLRLTALALTSVALLAACGGSDAPIPEETRSQDSRVFSPA